MNPTEPIPDLTREEMDARAESLCWGANRPAQSETTNEDRNQ